MINFRYHLVSLTAVFLALTVGLILGTAALNGPAIEVLEANTQSLRDSNAQYRAEIESLEAQLEDDQSFATEIAPTYLTGQLTDQNILVVALPGVETEVVDGVQQMLDYAGAGSAGTISILDDYFDPTNTDQLADLVERVTPDTVEAPVTYDGVEAMSYVLAAVTTGTVDGKAVEIEDGDITTAITGLEELSMITVADQPSGAATGVIVLGGQAFTDSDAEDRNAGVVSLATAYAGDAPTVYGATSAVGDDNPVNTFRAEDSQVVISTVDNVASPQGQIAAVVSLGDLISDGTEHDLGTGEGAEGLLPAAA
ncbi:copper transporter [Glycomyces buryatensis]|uniref:copper transporter n=1 Tax=Glycomyces buryatensis TaxID=2570927 RepID=UPI00145629AB|nr:copper transporter [Glycomyces buryatensis]